MSPCIVYENCKVLMKEYNNEINTYIFTSKGMLAISVKHPKKSQSDINGKLFEYGWVNQRLSDHLNPYQKAGQFFEGIEAEAT